MSAERPSDPTQQGRRAAFDLPVGDDLANGIALAILNALLEGRDRDVIEGQLLQTFNVNPAVLRVCIVAVEEQLRRHERHAAACTGSAMRR